MKSILEFWKDIEEFEGKYQVSNLGRVKSLNRIRKAKSGGTATVRERLLKIQVNNCGYQFVLLGGKCYLVHRLVCKAFVNNDDPLYKTEVNHKDQNKLNNKWDNLEWCDRSYNTTYNDAIERRLKSYKETISKKRTPIKKVKIIQQFTKDGILINTYPSVVEAGKQTGISQSNIIKCLKGNLKSAGGYIWKRIITYKPL